MQKIIKYIATDGKEFQSEYDCINYELNLDKPNSNDLMLLDENFNRLPNSPESLVDTFYIKIENEKALKWVKTINHEYGYYSPTSIGNYYYDYDIDMWCEIDSILTKAKNIIKAFDLKFME